MGFHLLFCEHIYIYFCEHIYLFIRPFSDNVIKTSEVTLTEEVKAFIEILYLIIGCGPLRV